MEVSMAQYPPGDPRLVDKIVGQLKSQGIFDRFRRECIADVDTKPAYQNLHQRVEASVQAFLAQQEWKPDLNKNQLRDSLRKHIHESGFLDIGVERIVDQVVNPKIVPVFLPQIEEVVYSCLGIEKPKKNKENFNVTMCLPPIQKYPEKKPEPLEVLNEMLPKDLDPISPESDTFKDEVETENDETLDKNKITEEEESSPPFEPIERIHSNNESNDSNLSDISGLTSEDSQITDISLSENKKDIRKSLDLTSQDSQISKASCNSKCSLQFSGDQHSSLKTIGDNERPFSIISDNVSKQKTGRPENVVPFSHQNNFQQSVESELGQSTHEAAHMSDGDKNKHYETTHCEDNVDKLQKLYFELSDSVSMHTEGTARSCTDESDTKSHHATGIESSDVSKTEISAVKSVQETVTFSEIFKEKNADNLSSSVVKSEQGCALDDDDDDDKVQENSNRTADIESSEDLKCDGNTQKVAYDFEEASVTKAPVNEEIFVHTCDVKSENLILANSVDGSFNAAEAESYPTPESPFTNNSKVTKDIDVKSDIHSDADTDTKDSRHYDSINESCSLTDTKFQEFMKSHEGFTIENPKDPDSGSKRLSFVDVLGKDRKHNSKEVLKQPKIDTETKNESVLQQQKDRKLEENMNRRESAKDLSKEQGKKEQNKDYCKERSRSEKEMNKDKRKHDKIHKDSNKYHSKNDKKKEGSKGHTQRDDSKERYKHNESRENKRDDKEVSKERHKNEDKQDKERSRHESKSEKDRGRDHSRHGEKNDKSSHKDRKEGNKESSKRDKGREKEDKSRTADKEKVKHDEKSDADKEKAKRDEKSDKHKSRADEKYRQEKDKSRNENSSSKSANQEIDYKEKHKSDSKRVKDKHKHEKSKHIAECKDAKSNEEKQGKDKEKTSKGNHREKLKDSVDITEKSHKDKSKQNERDKKSHDKSRESSSSSSSRKSDKKTETSKSKGSEDKNKEKKRESKSKAVSDDHFVHRDKNTEDRRSTDRDSNGASCDKARDKSTESHSSQKQEKKSNRQHNSGKADGGTNESHDINTEFEECTENNEDNLFSKSPDSSPTSLLPFKKRSLEHESDADDGLDEYSCSTDSGKLILKLKKPKIASNIFEVKKIMQLRKSMAKMERKRFHNGQQNERKKAKFTQQTDTKDTGTTKEEVELKSDNLVEEDPDYKEVMKKHDDVTNEGVKKPLDEPFLSKESAMSSKSEVKEVSNNNGTDINSVLKDEVDHRFGEDHDNEHENKLKYFEQETEACTESLAAYIETYERNLYSDPVCFTDCSESENEEVSNAHSFSHLKCKVVKEIVEEYVRRHHGMDSNFSISVTEADTAVEALRTEEDLEKSYNTFETQESSTVDDKVSDTKRMRNHEDDGTLVTATQMSEHTVSSVEKTVCDMSTVRNESITTVADSRYNPNPEQSKANLHSGKKLCKGYVLQLLLEEQTQNENNENSLPNQEKQGSSEGKNKNPVSLNSNINPQQGVSDLSNNLKSTSKENNVEHVPPYESHHRNTEAEKTLSVNHKSHNGPSNRYVVADSDDEDARGDNYNSDSNTVDKSSSDDEKVPLSTDLIFHSLRDLMLESGMQKHISPEKITGISEMHPKPESEMKQKLLGRSRRPGLSRPAPGKGIVVNSSNGKISSPEFVLPLSPESDISASSSEPNKKITVGRDAAQAAHWEMDTHKSNQDENKRTLRSAAGAHRGQRYSSDELYKPRPLFHITSRRTKSKLMASTSPIEEVSVKKRRSTVEGYDSSVSEKRTYR